MSIKGLDPLAALILHTLQKQFGPLDGKVFLVAYSGGGDSTALLGLLCKIQPHAGFLLRALWVDHGLRPAAERQKEKNLVERCCHQLGIDLVQFFLPPETGPKPGGTEAWARRHRQKFLREEAQRCGAAAVLTAHHRDDQVETVLMRLFRGRSYLGLGGIPPRSGVFFRPLLSCSRENLRRWLASSGLEWWEDSTNAQGEYERNKLRLELTPVLDRLYPQWRRAVSEWSDEQRARLGRMRRDLVQSLDGNSGLPVVPRSLWDSWDRERKIWFLAKSFAFQGEQRIPRGWFLQAIQDLSRRGATETYRGTQALWEGETLKVDREVAKKPDIGYFKTIEWDCSIPLFGRNFVLSREAGEWQIPYSQNGLRLLSRNWAEGLDFPGGGKRLKDLFQSWKIPPSERGGVTVLADREKILGIFAKTDQGQVWVRPPEPGQRVMYLTVR